jgi:hypothetical protein
MLFHGKEQSVGIQPKQVTGFLNNLLLSMEQHLNPDDLRPSPNFTYVCRPFGVEIKLLLQQVDLGDIEVS